MKQILQSAGIMALLLFGACNPQSQKTTSVQTESHKEHTKTSKDKHTLDLKGYKTSSFSEALTGGKRILDEEGWNVWGCSPIMGEDGKVHIFFSRWEGEHKNWLTNSEIAHAVADHPEGPYTVIGTVLKGRGKGHWDAHTIHNPTVHKIGDKYVMYYIGNNLDDVDKYDGHHASTQRVGMAVADDLNGEWKRYSEDPILDISTNAKDWDSYLTTNPATFVDEKGKVWLYYKAWDRYNDGMRKMGVAVADSWKGPYKKYEGNPIVSFSHLKKQVEDAYVFSYNKKRYMVMRDMGVIHPHCGLILESEDGLNWSEPQLGYNFSTAYLEGEEKIERFERPQVLMIDGKPSYLFLAAMGGQNKKSTAAVLKIDTSKLDELTASVR